jgi:RHS repeat-associated protein
MGCWELQLNNQFFFVDSDEKEPHPCKFVFIRGSEGFQTIVTNPNVTNPNAHVTPESGVGGTDMLYSGEQFDPNLQMQYLRARYYDQSNGRFNRLDPFNGNMGDPQSLHKYAYCHNDPVNGIDPSGRMSLVEQLAVTSINFVIKTIKLATTLIAKNKIEFTLSIVKGLLVGSINAWTNSYLSSKEAKLTGWQAFFVGFTAGFFGQFIAMKLSTIPSAGAIVENLIINFGTEVLNDTDMTLGQFVFYLVEATIQGRIAHHFNNLPIRNDADKFLKIIAEYETGTLINIVRGYRRFWAGF